jgi:hypothetical protein
MSTVSQNSRYTKRYQQNMNGKSQDRISYNDRYRSESSFLDKYRRPKTASYYSATRDINNR